MDISNAGAEYDGKISASYRMIDYYKQMNAIKEKISSISQTASNLQGMFGEDNGGSYTYYKGEAAQEIEWFTNSLNFNLVKLQNLYQVGEEYILLAFINTQNADKAIESWFKEYGMKGENMWTAK